MPTIKTAIICLLVGFLFGLLTCKNCTPPCPTAPESIKSDTAIKYLPSDTSDFSEPILVLEGGRIPTTDKPYVPPIINLEPLPIDTNNITAPLVAKYNILLGAHSDLLEEWMKERVYKNTHRFNDSAVVTTENVVTQNKLIRSRAVLDSIRQIIVTNTITKTVVERKAIGYFGFRSDYNLSDTTLYLGAALSIKLKNDMRFGITGRLNTRANAIFGIEADVPIRLKRK